MQKILPPEISDLQSRLDTSEGAERMEILHSLAVHYAETNPQTSEKYSGEGLELARKLNEDLWTAKFLLLHGRTRYNSNDIVNALEYLTIASSIFEKFDDELNIADCLLRIGRCQDLLGDSSRGLENHFKALKISQSLRDKKLESRAYMEMGLSCWANKDSALALEHLNKAYELQAEGNSKGDLAAITGNIGNVYIGMQDYKTAYKYFQKCLDIFKELNSEEGIGKTYISIGITLWGIDKLDDALEYVNKCLTIFERLDNKEVIAESYSVLGSIYTDKGEFETAQIYFDKALDISKEYNLQYKLENLYESKYQCAEKMGDYKTAFNFSKKHHEAVSRRLKEAAEVKTNYLNAMHDMDLLRNESENLSEKNTALSELNQQLNSKNNTLSDTLNTLHSQNAEIERINKINSKILSILAHDLKNPLGIIQQVTEMYSSNTIDESMVGEVLQDLHKNSKAALEMLTDVLQWGTAQVGKKNAADFSEINLRDLVNAKQDGFSLLLKSKNNTLINSCDENFVFKGDINMIRVIIRNLITNANKFTSGGTITVGHFDKPDEIEITVSDTGIGMNSSQIERLFKWETRQSSDGTSGEKGTGIGLLLCQEFVQAHKGKIWAESAPGKGTSFHFTVSKSL
ncbi:MAG: tetratricopeptide repeat protein [Bacteroidetes bacterium]|nr:tetratricopeptide repeat protein [Bacteroidota bacterium]